ncbi:hypothetical protein D3C78_1345410 [compost metagenome]
MQRQRADTEQGQGVDQLVEHAGLEHRQILGAQAAAQTVGGKGAEGHSGETEEGGKQDEQARHGRTPQTGTGGMIAAGRPPGK